MSRNCPYLDTVKRSFLDFDFEKLCSVSLSDQNVYGCLVCGKYFQGKTNKPGQVVVLQCLTAHHQFSL